jgi:hypothetical protein
MPHLSSGCAAVPAACSAAGGECRPAPITCPMACAFVFDLLGSALSAIIACTCDRPGVSLRSFCATLPLVCHSAALFPAGAVHPGSASVSAAVPIAGGLAASCVPRSLCRATDKASIPAQTAFLVRWSWSVCARRFRCCGILPMSLIWLALPWQGQRAVGCNVHGWFREAVKPIHNCSPMLV